MYPYEGMTVNERLFAAGLLDDFEIAVKNKDAVMVASILQKVKLSPNNIAVILKQLKLE